MAPVEFVAMFRFGTFVVEEVLGELRNLTVRSFGSWFTGIFFILFSFLILLSRDALIRSLKEEQRLTRVRMLHNKIQIMGKL